MYRNYAIVADCDVPSGYWIEEYGIAGSISYTCHGPRGTRSTPFYHLHLADKSCWNHMLTGYWHKHTKEQHDGLAEQYPYPWS